MRLELADLPQAPPLNAMRSIGLRQLGALWPRVPRYCLNSLGRRPADASGSTLTFASHV
jgi:hypothetical protein